LFNVSRYSMIHFLNSIQTHIHPYQSISAIYLYINNFPISFISIISKKIINIQPDSYFVHVMIRAIHPPISFRSW
jgi:hypothetical protein